MSFSSMTGFARQAGTTSLSSWVWELKSVNGKALDLRIRLPNGFDNLEILVRQQLLAHFRRGNIQISLSLTNLGSSEQVKINQPLLEQYVAIAADLQNRLGATPPSPEGLLSLRGVIEIIPETMADDDRAQLDGHLLAGLKIAAQELLTVRHTEGARTRLQLESMISEIEGLIRRAAENSSRKAEAIQQRLKEQVERITNTSNAFDPDRLHQEAVILATRADIQEELDRLTTHIAAARDLMNSPEPVGRKFDFLAQEFNREANTLCSKSNDPGLTAVGLELKTLIDQLREQVQNIE